MALNHDPTLKKPIRLWPGVVAVVLQWLAWAVLPKIFPQYGSTGLMITAVCAVIILVWWLFFSRAPWFERLGAIALMVLGVIVSKRFVHESISNGAMGYLLYILAIPGMCLALVLWAVITRSFSSAARRVALVVVILLACGSFLLIRTNGMFGEGGADLEWRWTPTAEERLLAETPPMPRAAPKAQTQPQTAPAQSPPEPAPTVPDDSQTQSAPTEAPADVVQEPEAIPAEAAKDTGIEWPGFRGAGRDSVVRGVRLKTDWSASPPVEIWRKPIGPAWSSFAVNGDRIYTQEQRGEEELVSAYDLKTGEPVWIHSDAARFWESNAGPGPRATPTLSRGRVYTLGGTGILNALNADDGSVVWSRNATSDTKKKVPDWGIASSPLVVGDVVVVATAGNLVAYNADTGKPRWFGPKGGWGYSSPQLSTLHGVQQIVFLNGVGAISLAPSDGKVLWQHAWKSDGIVQPAVIEGSDVLIGSGSGLAGNTGLLRATVAKGPNGWQVKERWTSIGLKPYFNDFVVHEGHAFGFDGSFISCITVADGERKWKGGRYGHGQLVLLPDQDLLLVLSEKGELALVSATADKFTEFARVPAIKGKTWNHPVLVGDVVLVRNGEEMAAFRLPREGN